MCIRDRIGSARGASQAARRIEHVETIAHRVPGTGTEPRDPVASVDRRRVDVATARVRRWQHPAGRRQGSSVGPNISDVTIEVQMEDAGGATRTALMPVMRYANFTDKTGDVAMRKLMIPVGNQNKAGDLSYVSLRDFLAAPAQFMSLPAKGSIKGGSLLAPRDRHALVSAQATFLPIPQQGQATFWPVIFNYQSSRKNPAVLTLLVTRQGTSMTIVDNARDTVGGDSW